MATRMAIMVDGRLQQVGSPREVYERPANLFVARFIGSPPMNSLPGTFEVREGEPSVRVGSGRWPLARGAAAPAEGRRVTVGVRPEHLFITPPGPGNGPGTGAGAGAEGGIDGVIAAVEWLGHERHLVCDVDGSRVTVRETSEHADPEPGRPVRLLARPDAVQLFDESSGDRLR